MDLQNLETWILRSAVVVLLVIGLARIIDGELRSLFRRRRPRAPP